jgi:hypothetical protein
MSAVFYVIIGIAGAGIVMIVLLSVALVRRSRTMLRNDSGTLDAFSGRHPLRGDQQETMADNASSVPGAVIHPLRGPLNSFPRGMSAVGREESEDPDKEYKGD